MLKELEELFLAGYKSLKEDILCLLEKAKSLLQFFQGPPSIKKLLSEGNISALVRALKYKDPLVSNAAVEALDKLGWRPDKGPVGALYWFRKRNWQKCIEIGMPALNPIIELIKNEPIDLETFQATIKILGELRNSAPVVPILKILETINVELISVATKKVLEKWDNDQRMLMKIRSLRALDWWKSTHSISAKCDICNRSVEKNGGYLLETNEILLSDKYIDHATSLKREEIQRKLQQKIKTSDPLVKMALTPVMEFLSKPEITTEIARSNMIEAFKAVTTPWLVCEHCLICYFTQNLELCKKCRKPTAYKEDTGLFGPVATCYNCGPNWVADIKPLLFGIILILGGILLFGGIFFKYYEIMTYTTYIIGMLLICLSCSLLVSDLKLARRLPTKKVLKNIKNFDI